jgi:hypothetical protein
MRSFWKKVAMDWPLVSRAEYTLAGAGGWGEAGG